MGIKIIIQSTAFPIKLTRAVDYYGKKSLAHIIYQQKTMIRPEKLTKYFGSTVQKTTRGFYLVLEKINSCQNILILPILPRNFVPVNSNFYAYTYDYWNNYSYFRSGWSPLLLAATNGHLGTSSWFVPFFSNLLNIFFRLLLKIIFFFALQ